MAGINATASESVDRGVCLCVCVSSGCVLVASGEGAEDEACGGGCVFTIHYLRGGNVPDKGCFMPLQRCKKIPADLVNTAERPCVRRLLSVSVRLSASPFHPFFSLLLTFVSHSSTFVELKRAINQTARASRELRVPGLCWFKRTCFFSSYSPGQR